MNHSLPPVLVLLGQEIVVVVGSLPVKTHVMLTYGVV